MVKKLYLLLISLILVGCTTNSNEAFRLNEIGIEEYNNKKYEEALEKFIEAAKKKSSPEYYQNQGMVLIQLEEYEIAIDVLKKALNHKNIPSEVYFLLGIGSMYIGDYNDALNYFDKVIDIDRKNIEAYLHKAVVQERLDNRDEAANTYNIILESHPEDKRIWNEKGLMFNKFGEYEEAIMSFNQAIIIDNDFGEAYNNRGVSYINLNLLDEAINDFEKAKTLLNASEVDLNIAIYYGKQQEVELALEYFNKVKNNNPTGKAYLLRGLFYMDNGDKNKGIMDLEKAFEKEEWRALLHLGIQFENALDYNKALEYYSLYNQLENAPWINNKIGVIQIKLKEYDEALKFFKRANELLPQNQEILFNIATTYQLLKLYDEAKKYLEEIIEINPHNEEVIKELNFLTQLMPLTS